MIFSLLSASPTRRVLGGLLLLIALVTLPGCGLGGKPTGRVSGKVTYRGQPITEGEVHFYAKESGVGASAPIDASGNFFFATPLDTGTYVAYVQPPIPEPSPQGRPMSKGLAVPRRYQGPDSGLSFSVKTGTNECSIDLMD